MMRGFAASAITVGLLLAGCTAIDYPAPTITVDSPDLQEISYHRWAEAPIPAGNLTAIGQAAGDLGDLVTDGTVYAIAGVEPAVFVALAIDAARYVDSVNGLLDSDPDYRSPPVPPTHQVWVADFDVASAPAALCAYFDPYSEPFTPPICQAPMSVVLDGVTYLAIHEPQSRRPVPIFVFESADLQAAGRLQAMDPRLDSDSPVDPTAYAIRGIASTAAIAVLIGADPNQRAYVFLAEDVPALNALCAYVEAEMYAAATEVGLLGCENGPDPSID